MVQIIESSRLTQEELQRLLDPSNANVINALITGESNEVNQVSDEYDEIAVPEAIPENNVTTAMDGDNTIRFSGASWIKKVGEQRISLIGAGGIGSWVGLFLSRIHPSYIDIYDPDRYDTSNMSGQFCRKESVGKGKAYELRNLMTEMSDYYLSSAYSKRIQETRKPFECSDIVIGGLDNMEARKAIFNMWKESPKGLFIDARLAAEEFQVYCFEGNDKYHIKEYEKNALFSDEEAEQVVCSYKQTSHCAGMVGAVITNLVTNYCARKALPTDSPEYLTRALPYFTTYDAVTMRLKTIMV